jgi:hypothetical protein
MRRHHAEFFCFRRPSQNPNFCLRYGWFGAFRRQDLQPWRFARQIGVIVAYRIVFVCAIKAPAARNGILEHRNIVRIPPGFANQECGCPGKRENHHARPDPAHPGPGDRGGSQKGIRRGKDAHPPPGKLDET